MKRTISILLALSLSIITACGEKRLSQPFSPDDKGVGITTEEEISDESPTEEPIVEDPQTEATPEEPEAASTTMGTPDPALYWRGDDYFDIEAYLNACGASYIALIAAQSENKFYVSTTINRRHVHIEGNGHSTIWVDYDGTTFATGDIKHADEVVWVSEKRNLNLSKTSLEILFTIMPNIIAEVDCPFAGSGLMHVDITTGAVHND